MQHREVSPEGEPVKRASNTLAITAAVLGSIGGVMAHPASAHARPEKGPDDLSEIEIEVIEPETQRKTGGHFGGAVALFMAGKAIEWNRAQPPGMPWGWKMNQAAHDIHRSVSDVGRQMWNTIRNPFQISPKKPPRRGRKAA